MDDNERSFWIHLLTLAAGMVCVAAAGYLLVRNHAEAGAALLTVGSTLLTGVRSDKVLPEAGGKILPIIVGVALGATALASTGCATVNPAAHHATVNCADDAIRAEAAAAGGLLATRITNPDAVSWESAEAAALAASIPGALCWATEFLSELATPSATASVNATPAVWPKAGGSGLPRARALALQRAAELRLR